MPSPGLPAAVARAWQATGLPAHALGVHVQPVRADRPALAAVNGEQAFALASTAKLVTTLAALDLLGPSYRWRTPAFLEGPLHDGVLDGDLRLLGGGDALLSTDELAEWFWRMRQQGLQQVRGDIVIDGLAFDLSPADLADTPPPSPDRPHHAWPRAFVVDEGQLRLRVWPGANGSPQVQPHPALPGLRMRAELSARGGCQVQADVLARDSSAPQLWVRGQWGPQCGAEELSLSPWSQAEYTERVVAALWRQTGGILQGRVRSLRPDARAGGWPRDAAGRILQPWAMHRSGPLRDWVREMNKRSDNLAARNLMLTMAPDFPIQPARLPQACQRVHEWLKAQGLRTGDITVASGSGLSRAERGKPRAMVHLLRQAWHKPQREPFLASLPVAGIDGTLKRRMVDGSAAGRAFLKTGTLLDARALAGYVIGRSGEAHAVTAVVNHPDAKLALPVLDRLIEWVATAG